MNYEGQKYRFLNSQYSSLKANDTPTNVSYNTYVPYPAYNSRATYAPSNIRQEDSYSNSNVNNYSIPNVNNYSIPNVNSSSVVNNNNNCSTKSASLWPLSCISCHEFVFTEEDFGVHMDRHWVSEKICMICKINIPNQPDKDRHFQGHCKEVLYVCSVCKMLFSRQEHVGKHFPAVHREYQSASLDTMYFAFMVKMPATNQNINQVLVNQPVTQQPASYPNNNFSSTQYQNYSFNNTQYQNNNHNNNNTNVNFPSNGIGNNLEYAIKNEPTYPDLDELNRTFDTILNANQQQLPLPISQKQSSMPIFQHIIPKVGAQKNPLPESESENENFLKELGFVRVKDEPIESLLEVKTESNDFNESFLKELDMKSNDLIDSNEIKQEIQESVPLNQSGLSNQPPMSNQLINTPTGYTNAQLGKTSSNFLSTTSSGNSNQMGNANTSSLPSRTSSNFVSTIPNGNSNHPGNANTSYTNSLPSRNSTNYLSTPPTTKPYQPNNTITNYSTTQQNTSSSNFQSVAPPLKPYQPSYANTSYTNSQSIKTSSNVPSSVPFLLPNEVPKFPPKNQAKEAVQDPNIKNACKECICPFTNLELFYDQWEQNWTQKTVCPLCGYFTYGRRLTFKEHLDGHIGQDLFLCLVCRTSSSRWDEMSIHLNSWHDYQVKQKQQKLFEKYKISYQWRLERKHTKTICEMNMSRFNPLNN